MPRKVLMDLNGKPMLAQLHRRLQACKEAFAVVVAAPIHDVKEIQKACPDIPVYGGPEEDLLTRLLGCAEEYEAYTLVRVTADCPLVCPDMIDRGIALLDKGWHRKERIPCVHNWYGNRTWPDGFDFDIWPVEFLSNLSDMIPREHREYFAQHVLSTGLSNTSMECPKNLSQYRLTVDYPEDLELIRKIYAEMGEECWGADLIAQWLLTNPVAAKMNAHRIDGKYGAKE
jgi:spore coat polysaccharide biosynthesis protein SpsF (cytidylyltransferase family)